MIFILEQGHKLGYFFPYTEREFYNLLKTLKAAGFKSSRLKGVFGGVCGVYIVQICFQH